MKTLILNFKNYAAAQGTGSLRLATAAERVSREVDAEIIIAPPAPMLGLVAAKTGIEVFSQAVSSTLGEKSTGSITPESIKAAGAAGTILNHSEARLRPKDLAALIPALRKRGLKVCLCAKDSREVEVLSRFETEYLAVEPPDLIGSGVAVSRVRPELVSKSVEAARGAGYEGSILCGAGIVDGTDVSRAVELGVDGVLVASSVVNAKDWGSKLKELSFALR